MAIQYSCKLLAVLCGNQSSIHDDPKYPFPEIASSGRLEVQVLNNPSPEELRNCIASVRPSIVYFQGENLQDNEVGFLKWAGDDLSTVDTVAGIFNTTLPNIVYMEIPNGEQLAKALHAKGILNVIYWQHTFTRFAACHFRNSLFSVVQSSSCHIWDAFDIAFASFSIYCVRSKLVLPINSPKTNNKLGPQLLGDPPKANVSKSERSEVDYEESPRNSMSAIRICDDGVTIKFLLCGTVNELDDNFLRSLVDGLTALLNIEIRGSKLRKRISAQLPPLEAGSFPPGFVTMRCNLSTCTDTRISLLVSGSAKFCFDDQFWENYIKNEVTENGQLVHLLPNCEENKQPLSEPRRSASLACGASLFEVRLKVPIWASQVLSQLAQNPSNRCLVALGIAGVHGFAVASFESNDAKRLLFFCSRQTKQVISNDGSSFTYPSWLKPPVPSRKRTTAEISTSVVSRNPSMFKKDDQENGDSELRNISIVTAMRPIPLIRHHKMLSFSATTEVNRHNRELKSIFPSVAHLSNRRLAGPSTVIQQENHANVNQAKQIIPLNPLPLEKHGCDRRPIYVCSEEEFLKDVMKFLAIRGHNRLIPQDGLAEFPKSMVNATRLDLFNLYREVVSRGGFYAGNINWTRQVFPKMRNHTATHRMTGVCYTLKRHYETYLLEYEQGHDDVKQEYCLLCHSSKAGNWLECGICGEWAHFDCDRRQGLGAFKDYAEEHGLQYICPQCSSSNFGRKQQKPIRG